MSLDKNLTITEVGRRTRLRNRDMQKMFEALIPVWIEELAQGERIEMVNFLALEVKLIGRGDNARSLVVGGKLRRVPRIPKSLSNTSEARHLKTKNSPFPPRERGARGWG